jgi:hypothetical protein
MRQFLSQQTAGIKTTKTIIGKAVLYTASFYKNGSTDYVLNKELAPFHKTGTNVSAQHANGGTKEN